jgi:hypothetical protein
MGGHACADRTRERHRLLVDDGDEVVDVERHGGDRDEPATARRHVGHQPSGDVAAELGGGRRAGVGGGMLEHEHRQAGRALHQPHAVEGTGADPADEGHLAENVDEGSAEGDRVGPMVGGGEDERGVAGARRPEGGELLTDLEDGLGRVGGCAADRSRHARRLVHPGGADEPAVGGARGA